MHVHAPGPFWSRALRCLDTGPSGSGHLCLHGLWLAGLLSEAGLAVSLSSSHQPLLAAWNLRSTCYARFRAAWLSVPRARVVFCRELISRGEAPRPELQLWLSCHQCSGPWRLGVLSLWTLLLKAAFCYCVDALLRLWRPGSKLRTRQGLWQPGQEAAACLGTVTHVTWVPSARGLGPPSGEQSGRVGPCGGGQTSGCGACGFVGDGMGGSGMEGAAARQPSFLPTSG